jgi:hypothetical protein
MLFAVFLLALFPAWNGLQPKLDEDTWWHLAVGKYVVDNGRVPTEDPFSRIGQEQHLPWVAYSWLHEVALYESYRLGGLSGILVFRHVLDSLTFLAFAAFIVHRSRGGILPLLVLGLATVTLVPIMLERPWHYTIVFTTLCLSAATEMRAGTPARRFWWLLPVFALWANLHIQFVLGFGVLGLGLLATAVERFRSGEREWPWPGWILLIAGCVLATLANPYHLRIYQVVWEYATQTGALRVVTELAPPDVLTWWNWGLFTLLAWAAVECVRRRLPVFDTAFLVVAAVFSLRMQRDIWFGSLVAAMVLTRHVPRPTASYRLPGELAAAIVAAILLARVVGLLTHRESPAEVNAKEFPAGAVEYLRTNRPSGPIFNHFNWGGYLIWTLPEYPVGMDGRTNLYGEERLLRAFNTWNGRDGWDQDPDLLAAGVILAPKKFQTELLDLLRASPGRWQVAYEDEVTVVFTPVTKR